MRMAIQELTPDQASGVGTLVLITFLLGLVIGVMAGILYEKRDKTKDAE
jgi:hypothetical protein